MKYYLILTFKGDKEICTIDFDFEDVTLLTDFVNRTLKEDKDLINVNIIVEKSEKE